MPLYFLQYVLVSREWIKLLRKTEETQVCFFKLILLVPLVNNKYFKTRKGRIKNCLFSVAVYCLSLTNITVNLLTQLELVNLKKNDNNFLYHDNLCNIKWHSIKFLQKETMIKKYRYLINYTWHYQTEGKNSSFHDETNFWNDI